MHRHFTDAGSVLLFGGGMKRGYLHGKTADERPCKTIEKRVVIEDLHASIYRAARDLPEAELRNREDARSTSPATASANLFPISLPDRSVPRTSPLR